MDRREISSSRRFELTFFILFMLLNSDLSKNNDHIHYTVDNVKQSVKSDTIIFLALEFNDS
jgi:hypothetical protein